MSDNKIKGEKENLKHGVNYFLRSGQLPSGRGMRKLKKYLEELEGDLMAQFGGIKNVTPMQAVQIRQYIKCHSICTLIEIFMNKHGVLRPDQERRKILQLHPVLERSYIQYQRLSKDILEQLFPDGLAQKGSDALDPATYLETYRKDKGKRVESDSKGQTGSGKRKP